MESAPLRSPVKQQAHDKIRGYAYQCWLTVEAWLRLGPRDTLFAECAEDFATFTEAGDANMVQAKATTANLSLRSSDAAEAINHYWDFRTQAESGEVQYSFLTTACITTEQNNPFNDVAGLALWREIAASGDLGKAEQLRLYLATDEQTAKKLSPAVIAFLTSATATEALEKLFRPIVWDTNHPDMAGVRASVENQLAILVETNFAASPTHRHNLADSLFTTINTVAAAKEKLPLTRGLLLSTTERHLIPAGHTALAARNQEVLGGMVVGGSTLATVWTFTEAVPPIALADAFSRRAPALHALQTTAGAGRFLLIEGSSGMGKSTLAQIYSAAVGGNWLHFRAEEQEIIRSLRGIQLCTAIIAREPAPFGLIIDDLPWALLDGTALSVIHGLTRAARQRGARLVFTNKRTPSAVNLAAVGLSDLIPFKAPVMDQSEVVEIAQRLGCTDIENAAKWAPLVVALSSGHPRLVHANLIGLKTRGWPEFSHDEFQAVSASLQQARDESQALLTGRRSEEVELLTRLSAFFGSFRRGHALAIAEEMERIVGAGVAFENLVGPWIEPFSPDRYRLSPLLGKTLLNGVSPRRAGEVHRAAIVAVVTTTPLEAGDATGALLNAVLGNASDYAAQLLMKFLMAPREHCAALHTHLVWMTVYATEGQPLFTDYPAVDFMFRVLQFEVAASVSPVKAAHFLELCDQMLANTTEREVAYCYRAILAYSLIKTNQTPVAFDRLFWSMAILRETAADMLKEGLAKPTKLLPIQLNPENNEDESEVFVVLEIWIRASTLDGLRRLLDTLTHAGDEDRAKYLAALSRAKASAIMCFDQVWLAEDKKAVRSWDPVLALFYDFLAAAEKWQSGLLAACAARGISVIQDEYLDKPSEAEKVLDRVATDDPAIQAIVTERRAKSAMLGKRYSDAQRLFEAALPHTPWFGFTAAGTITLYQNAGTTAGKAADWSAASKHFLAGSELAQKDGDPTSAFALLADSAYATWQLGDKPLAVTRLGEAWGMIPTLPDPATRLRTRRTLRLFGHLLAHLAWANTGRRAHDATPSIVTAGMCSEAREDVDVPELTVPDSTLQEIIYLSLVFLHLPESPLLESRLSELVKSASPLARYFALELHARHLLRAHDLGKLLECALATSATLQLCNGLEQAESGVFSRPSTVAAVQPTTLLHPFPITMLLLAGLTVGQLTGADVFAILTSWRVAAKGTPIEIELLSLLNHVESALNGSSIDAATGAASGPDDYVRWPHALRLLQDINPTPNGLMIATVFFTFCHWPIARFPWLADTVQLLDQAISDRWRQACEQRNAFRYPTLFIPDIKALAATPDGTVAHIAKMVVIAQPALHLRIEDSLLQDIRAVAAGQSNLSPASSTPPN